jgi:Rps23 Pro-64 3,4-dihydroxylase Tpa1-like proline 4-hydroxylase
MVTKIENFFEKEFLQETLKYVDDLLKNSNSKFTTSISSWSENIIENSLPVFTYSFSQNDQVFLLKLKEKIEQKITQYIVVDVNLYLWPKLSYIPWHNDAEYKAALTIYLNQEWGKNWGGYLMYEENDEIKAIKPEFNLGVLQEGGVKHCVTTVNINAKNRITLQCFINKQKKVI